MSAEQARLIALVGATGTGKSGLSLELAERLAAGGHPAEVVGADAMQLYRGMDIGTAKLPVSERRGIPHHLIDVLEVTDEATVAAYQIQARAAIEDIQARGHVPILVGGSGLYVSAVLHDLRFPGRDPRIRSRLEDELERDGVAALHERVRAADPAAAARIDPANARRVIRALEVIELRGGSYSGMLPERPSPWQPATVLGLSVPRPELTPRLDARVQGMWADGLVEEVASLIPAGLERGVTARRAIGYAQALAQLHGTLTEHDAIAQTQQLTRRYARRQVSWFKRYPDALWLEGTAPDLAERAFRAVSEASIAH